MLESVLFCGLSSIESMEGHEFEPLPEPPITSATRSNRYAYAHIKPDPGASQDAIFYFGVNCKMIPQSTDQSAVNSGDSDNLSLWQMGRNAAASMYQQLIYHFHIR